MNASNIRRDEGVVLVIAMLCIVALGCLVGLVVDSGMLEYRKLTLHKAATAATLRASQKYYDGTGPNLLVQLRAGMAARESAKLNLKLSGVDSQAADAAAVGMTLEQDEVAGTVTAAVDTGQKYFFSQLMPNVGTSRNVRTEAAASYLKKEAAPQYYGRIYVVMSVFSSMAAPFQGNAGSTTKPKGSQAQAGSKGSVGVDALQELIDALNGQLLTLVGYGEDGDVFTRNLPINDDWSSPDPTMSNRDYAKQQSEKLLKLDRGAALSEALEYIIGDMKKLDSIERQQVLVLVISDSIVFDVFRAPFTSGCSLDIGRSIDAANSIRDLGGTLHSVALYTDPAKLKLEGETKVEVENLQEMLVDAQLFGRDFLKSLAAEHKKSVPCDASPRPSRISPNSKNAGRYMEPRSPREAAIFVDEITSKKSFVSKLPHRVDAQ